MKSCVVIGGGVIGHFSAYYLAKSGHQVTLVDESDLGDGCSYGNAGMVVPSHLVPIAQPGMISKGVRWMFNARSPFYIRPRLSKDLLVWCLKFYRSANEKHVQASIPALRDLSLYSKMLYKELAKQHADIAYREKGLLMLYQSQKVGEEEEQAAQIAKAAGLEVNTYDSDELKALESNLVVQAKGGIHYRSDAHLDPNRLMRVLKGQLKELKVKVISNCRVQNYEMNAGRLSKLITTQGDFAADEFIFCAGAWTAEILKQMGIRVSILPGKGYSFDVEKTTTSPSIPSILCEGKVAVTPLEETVRFAGTLELTHTRDTTVNHNRVKGILQTIQSFYPELPLPEIHHLNIWQGYRPCTPNGLPLISRTPKLKNVIVASGHGMMGLSLAPATGSLVDQLVREVKPEVNLGMFGGR